MRFIAFILSMYILVLALVPCSDGLLSSCTDSTDHEFSQLHQDKCHYDDHSDGHSEDHEDDCTPFCTCICCGSIINMPESSLIFVDHLNLRDSRGLPNYDSKYFFDYSFLVWHPPAIS